MQKLGTKLNRLIKDRSYTAGRFARLATEKQRLMKRIAEIEALQCELDASLSHIDTQIRVQSSINTEHIRAIKPSETQPKVKYGAIMRGAVEYFRRNGGRPIRTDELQLVIDGLSGFRGGPRTSLKNHTNRICRTLKLKGWLERLPDSPEPEVGRVFGVWRWVGNEAMNAVDKARGLNENSGSSETFTAIVEPVDGDS